MIVLRDTSRRPLVHAFRGVKYGSPEELFSNARSLSEQIQLKTTREKNRAPLSPFTLRVKELAPSFVARQYSPREIADAILSESNSAGGNSAARKRTLAKVKRSLLTLKNLGEIQNTTPQDRVPWLPVLRKVTSSAMTEHAYLVDSVLKRSHKFCLGWHRALPRDEARMAGLVGLSRAIETFDESRGASFPTYARNCIASKIGDAAKQRRKQTKGETEFSDDIESVSFDASDTAKLKQQLHRLVGSHIANPSNVPAHSLMLWTLHIAFGHSVRQLGNFFGVAPDAIHTKVRAVNTFLRLRH